MCRLQTDLSKLNGKIEGALQMYWSFEPLSASNMYYTNMPKYAKYDKWVLKYRISYNMFITFFN